jgi:hypothetical protein
MCFLVLCDMTLYTTFWTLNLLVLPMHLKMKIFNENWMEFEFNNWTQIQSKKNGMQIAEKHIQNLLMNMMLEKKKLFKNMNMKKYLLFMGFHFRMG